MLLRRCMAAECLATALGNALIVGQSEKLRITFEHTASTDKSLYTGMSQFNTGCNVNLFP